MAPSSLLKKFATRLVLLLAVVVWPISWGLSGWIHHQHAPQSLADIGLHVMLILLGPRAALMLAQLSDELSHSR